MLTPTFKPGARVFVNPENESGNIVLMYSKFEDGVWARIELDSDVMVDYPVTDLVAENG